MFLPVACQQWPEEAVEPEHWESLPSLENPFRSQSRLRLESKLFSGEFTAVCIAEPGPEARARMQWFPDLGGKVLDLNLSPQRIQARMLHGDMQLDWSSDSGEPLPRQLLSFIALSLQARLLPRQAGPALSEDGFRTLHSPVPGLRIRVQCDHQGKVLRWVFRYRGVQWQMNEGSPRRIEAKDFTVEIWPESLDEEASFSDRIFQFPDPEA
ncbi:MAG: hypothetical protein DWQ01_06675 [Planctomycetota bacterium]|nr:MAG: hypothetical protein DWQ01_06675 [Planctomycetota bacterium]